MKAKTPLRMYDVHCEYHDEDKWVRNWEIRTVVVSGAADAAIKAAIPPNSKRVRAGEVHLVGETSP